LINDVKPDKVNMLLDITKHLTLHEPEFKFNTMTIYVRLIISAVC